MKKINPFKKEFECFKVCSQTLNISQAAELLSLSQPSVSKLIHQLESELQVKLFIRKVHGLALTQEGVLLKERLQTIDQTWSEIHLNHKSGFEWSKKIKIGFHETIAQSVFPKIFKNLYSLNPDVQLTTHFDRSTQITHMVNSFEIDLGFVINPIKQTNLVAKKIRSEFISVWGKNQQSKSEIVLYNSQMYLAPKLIHDLNLQYKLVPVDSYEVIASSVQTGDFLGILPNPVAQIYHLKPMTQELLRVDLCAIFHAERYSVSDKKGLVHFINTHMRFDHE